MMDCIFRLMAELSGKFDSQVFPTVSTKDLVIHPREDLVIGTFGRAAWVMTISI